MFSKQKHQHLWVISFYSNNATPQNTKALGKPQPCYLQDLWWTNARHESAIILHFPPCIFLFIWTLYHNNNTHFIFAFHIWLFFKYQILLGPSWSWVYKWLRNIALHFNMFKWFFYPQLQFLFSAFVSKSDKMNHYSYMMHLLLVLIVNAILAYKNL